MGRSILHVDMDEFFVAVERREAPALKGKCVLVAGAVEARGVVCSASYEARAFGCRSAMPTAAAIRLCPKAIVLPPRHGLYSQASAEVFSVFDRFTPQIQPLSIDEAFLDITGTEGLFGPPEKAAMTIKQMLREELGLIASVGLAPNMFLAKLASDMDKPDGLTIIRPEGVHAVLDPLPIKRLWGVGPATGKRLAGLGIATIGELRRMDRAILAPIFGQQTEQFLKLAAGEDDRRVVPDQQAKSIGQEQTFAQDIDQPAELRRVLRQQVEQVAGRLRKHRLLARTVHLKVRGADFNTFTRSETLPHPTDVTSEIQQAVGNLFTVWTDISFQPLRLIGMSVSNLTQTAGQPSLFADPNREKLKQLDSTVDRIRDRFGPDSISRG